MTVDRDELRQVTADHPGTAALLLELLVHERMPETVPPLQIEEHAGPDAAALLEELSEVQTENQSLRGQLAHELERRDEREVELQRQVADVQEQLQAALDLGHAVGAEKNDDELADLKQQLAGARVQIESLEGQRAAHLRELHALRQRPAIRSADEPMNAPPTIPAARGETTVEAAPCRVDGCDGAGPLRGQWAKLCQTHRAELAAGGVVTVDGKTCQRLAKGLTAVRATHCEDCGAKLSQYRKASETRCATHAGVTA